MLDDVFDRSHCVSCLSYAGNSQTVISVLDSSLNSRLLQPPAISPCWLWCLMSISNLIYSKLTPGPPSKHALLTRLLLGGGSSFFLVDETKIFGVILNATILSPAVSSPLAKPNWLNPPNIFTVRVSLRAPLSKFTALSTWISVVTLQRQVPRACLCRARLRFCRLLCPGPPSQTCALPSPSAPRRLFASDRSLSLSRMANLHRQLFISGTAQWKAHYCWSSERMLLGDKGRHRRVYKAEVRSVFLKQYEELE